MGSFSVLLVSTILTSTILFQTAESNPASPAKEAAPAEAEKKPEEQPVANGEASSEETPKPAEPEKPAEVAEEKKPEEEPKETPPAAAPKEEEPQPPAEEPAAAPEKPAEEQPKEENKEVRSEEVPPPLPSSNPPSSVTVFAESTKAGSLSADQVPAPIEVPSVPVSSSPDHETVAEVVPSEVKPDVVSAEAESGAAGPATDKAAEPDSGEPKASDGAEEKAEEPQVPPLAAEQAEPSETAKAEVVAESVTVISETVVTSELVESLPSDLPPPPVAESPDLVIEQTKVSVEVTEGNEAVLSVEKSLTVTSVETTVESVVPNEAIPPPEAPKEDVTEPLSSANNADSLPDLSTESLPSLPEPSSETIPEPMSLPPVDIAPEPIVESSSSPDPEKVPDSVSDSPKLTNGNTNGLHTPVDDEDKAEGALNQVNNASITESLS